MNFQELKNNALFLSCWYERSRPVQMICFGVMILGIMLLSFLSVTFNEHRPEEIGQSLYYVVVGIQAVILLVQGTMFAWKMGARERTSETLDFHRNSPQPIDAKMIGLILGSTWFEWAIFGALFLLELPFAILPNVNLNRILLFNASLALSGVFFHTTAATVSLLSTPKKRGGSLIPLLLAIWMGGPFLLFYLSTASSPFFSYLFGAAAVKYISSDNYFHLRGWFYSLDFPLILLQALIQVPLLFVMAGGMKRIFRRPNSPVWSKAHVILFCGFLFFMLTGFFTANYTHLDEFFADNTNFSYRYYNHSFRNFFEPEAYIYTIMFVAAGILAGFLSVPSYFKRSKYFVYPPAGGAPAAAFLDDGASVFVTLFLYVGMGWLFFLPYLAAIHSSLSNAFTYIILNASYIFAFGGFWEYYRLSRFRNNKIFLVTVLMVAWVFFPWLMALLFNFQWDRQIYLIGVSPFVGIYYSLEMLTQAKDENFYVLIAPCLVAGIMWLLAWQEHAAVRKQISD